jgi:hypothetical protein
MIVEVSRLTPTYETESPLSSIFAGETIQENKYKRKGRWATGIIIAALTWDSEVERIRATMMIALEELFFCFSLPKH